MMDVLDFFVCWYERDPFLFGCLVGKAVRRYGGSLAPMFGCSPELVRCRVTFRGCRIRQAYRERKSDLKFHPRLDEMTERFMSLDRDSFCVPVHINRPCRSPQSFVYCILLDRMAECMTFTPEQIAASPLLQPAF